MPDNILYDLAVEIAWRVESIHYMHSRGLPYVTFQPI